MSSARVSCSVIFLKPLIQLVIHLDSVDLCSTVTCDLECPRGGIIEIGVVVEIGEGRKMLLVLR